jgi:hypothetical protein
MNDLKEYDIVINKHNGEEYYISKIETVYDVDSGTSKRTGYIECRPYYLDKGLPDYNRFSIDDIELKQ